MKRRLIFLLCLLSITAGLSFSASGQSSSPPKGWHMLDPEQDHVQGISADRVYVELLKTRPSTPIIVAIIDSGIDINHEDLKSIIWTNPREIEGNGLDDDGNGYIDDIHGWNFLGGANGEVDGDTYELTREYVRLDKKFGKLQENKIPGKLKKEYEEYTRVKDKFLRLRDENRDEYEYYANTM